MINTTTIIPKADSLNNLILDQLVQEAAHAEGIQNQIEIMKLYAPSFKEFDRNSTTLVASSDVDFTLELEV